MLGGLDYAVVLSRLRSLAGPAGASLIGFLQSGTGAISRTAQAKGRERFTPEDNNLVGDGVTVNTAAAMLQLFANAVAAKRPVDFGTNVYLVDGTIALTTAHNGLTLIANGGGGLKKGANGSLVTVTGTVNFEAYDVTFDGQHGTYTGKGIVFSGNANYPKFPGCTFKAFTDSHIEFGPDSGYDFKAPGARFLLSGAQTNPRCIHVNGPDLGAAHRHFVDVSLDGYFDLDGALSTRIAASRFNTIENDANCSVLEITGNTWAASSAITINGANVVITGNRIAAAVTLAAGSSGTFVGNHPTSGTLTNSAAAGNWVILHREGGSNVYKVGQHVLDSVSSPAAPACIPSHRPQFVGDTGLSWISGTHGDHVIFQTPITADRTVTFATSAPVPPTGAVVRVTRQAAATGAFNVIAGPTGATLAAGEWIDHIWDSGAWQASAGGTIPT